MFFTKYPHAANFSYAQGAGPRLQVGSREVEIALASFADGVNRVTLRNPDIWDENLSLIELNAPEASAPRLDWDGHVLTIRNERGEPILTTRPEAGIGLNGQASLFQFATPTGCRFYGQGGKSMELLEFSGTRTVTYNTDVWSDFHFAQWKQHHVDPTYFSTPYLAVRLPDGSYAGILFHNPAPVFIECPGTDENRVFVAWQRTSDYLLMGAYDGQPDLWVVTADDLPTLTERVNRLIGVTPTPPLWSLGYHQSRWGYGGHDDLTTLDKAFSDHETPCTGLWLDLDYMDGYRIFTVHQDMFPKGPAPTAKILAEQGRRIVPIIDPGVKKEVGYQVYDDGIRAGIFCQNREGQPYTGMVWPGETVFPDFTLAEARDWFAGYVKAFRESGFGACWVDMNDPSTGPAHPDDMLFGRGAQAHHLHRNQYALGMQMSAHAGFLAAKPNERPFILSRSGFIGSSRYSAIWTGDNTANDFYLRLSLVQSMSMGISGHVFNGADVGGFGDDTNPKLLSRWQQAVTFQPFCRNHSTASTREQDPFAWDQKTTNRLVRYIRLRQRALPYLYALFAHHEETGAAIVRPLVYHYDNPALDQVKDEVLCGPFLLHAPVVAQDATARDVVLPGDQPWYDARTGDWVKPGTHSLKVSLDDSPLYLAAGAIVPLQRAEPKGNDIDLLRPRVLLAAPATGEVESHFDLVADDGLSFDYQKGKRSILRVHLRAKDGVVEISTEAIQKGFGSFRPEFVLVSEAKSVTLNGKAVSQRAVRDRLTGGRLTWFRLG